MASGKLPHYVPAKGHGSLSLAPPPLLLFKPIVPREGGGWASQVEGGGLPRWRDLEGGVGTFSEGHCLLQ